MTVSPRICSKGVVAARAVPEEPGGGLSTPVTLLGSGTSTPGTRCFFVGSDSDTAGPVVRLKYAILIHRRVQHHTEGGLARNFARELQDVCHVGYSYLPQMLPHVALGSVSPQSPHVY